jgi:hypothetical protein
VDYRWVKTMNEARGEFMLSPFPYNALWRYFLFFQEEAALNIDL